MKKIITNIYNSHIRFQPMQLALKKGGYDFVSFINDEHDTPFHSEDADAIFLFNYPINQEIVDFVLKRKVSGQKILAFMDDPLAFFDPNCNRFLEILLKVADKVYTSTDNMIEIYSMIGVEAKLLVGLANPLYNVTIPISEAEVEYDWGFIGTLTPQRFRFFWHLEKLLPNTSFYYIKEGFNTQQVIERIRKTRVNIVYGNYSDIIDFKANGSTFRAWEFPYAGAFILHDERPLLSRFFKEGKSIITFSTPEVCAELVQFYLDKPDERRRITANAREVILKYKMEDKLPELFDSL